MKRLLVIGCLCGIFMSPAFLHGDEWPFKERKQENLIHALTNEQFQVGAFEVPDAWTRGEKVYAFRDGTRFEPFQAFNRDCWRMLKTTSGIKGDFGAWVFFQECVPFLEPLFNPPFDPNGNSAWIVIFESQLDEAGELFPDAAYTQQNLLEHPFFRHDNLFKVYDKSQGVFRIGWTEEYPPRIGEELYSANLVARLQEIVAESDFPPDEPVLRQKVASALSDCFLGTYSPPPEEPDVYVTRASSGMEVSINERKIKNLVNALTNEVLEVGAFAAMMS